MINCIYCVCDVGWIGRVRDLRVLGEVNLAVREVSDTNFERSLSSYTHYSSGSQRTLKTCNQNLGLMMRRPLDSVVVRT